MFTVYTNVYTVNAMIIKFLLRLSKMGLARPIINLCFGRARYEMLKFLLIMCREEKGFLRTLGWLRSVAYRKIIDKDHNPLPWITYPCIDLLNEHLKPSFRVFEFGCGSSTSYFAARVGEVVCVEHDAQWIPKLSEK